MFKATYSPEGSFKSQGTGVSVALMVMVKS